MEGKKGNIMEGPHRRNKYHGRSPWNETKKETSWKDLRKPIGISGDL